MDMSTATSTDAMSMSMSPSSTMSGMSMGSATDSSMPMSTDSSGAMMMDMSSMAMTFFTATDTPLFSMGWAPGWPGTYAGTCVFLIALAAAFRALLAVRTHFYSLLAAADLRRNGGLAYQPYRDQKSPSKRSSIHPWRSREAFMVATLDMTSAGVGYLLMIAVMTMNVGYFLSVLAGIFVGSLAFGRFTASASAY